MAWKKGDDGKYVRTVRCSYCYELGHNRSTCPELKKYIDKLRKENGDHTYSVADYDRMKKKRSNRSCSYCKDKGHNTRSCLLYTSPSPRDRQKSRMPSSA